MDATQVNVEGEAVEVKAFDLSILDGCTIDELQAIKDKVTAMLKERKAEVKAVAEAIKAETKEKAKMTVAKAIEDKVLIEGKAKVEFTMNGKTWVKVAGKITDKTVAVDMTGDVDTPRKMRYVKFDKILSVQAIAEPEGKAKPEGAVEAASPKSRAILHKADKGKGPTPEGQAALDAVAELTAKNA